MSSSLIYEVDFLLDLFQFLYLSAMNTDLSRLKPLLLCKGKQECLQDCCTMAVEALENEPIVSFLSIMS